MLRLHVEVSKGGECCCGSTAVDAVAGRRKSAARIASAAGIVIAPSSSRAPQFEAREGGRPMRTLRRLALGHVALLLIASSGCAAKTSRQWLPEQVRSELGTVAVVASPEPPDSSFAYPVPSRAGAAATGAGAALGVGALAGVACFAYVLPGCLIALWTPVMMVTNGVEGAVKGVPIADLRSSAVSLKNAAGERDLAGRFAERVAAEAQRRVGKGGVRFAVKELPDSGKLRYAALAAAGVDTVLEVQLDRLRLERAASPSAFSGYGPSLISVEKLIDAPLAFTIEARIRVLRAADSTVLYKAAFTRRTGHQKFTEWGREDAAQFKSERDRALESIADEIAGELFGPIPAMPEPTTTSEPTPTPEPATTSD
jgi:hypothetical protein